MALKFVRKNRNRANHPQFARKRSEDVRMTLKFVRKNRNRANPSPIRAKETRICAKEHQIRAKESKSCKSSPIRAKETRICANQHQIRAKRIPTPTNPPQTSGNGIENSLKLLFIPNEIYIRKSLHPHSKKMNDFPHFGTFYKSS
jgi:hypothetical protein